MKYIIKKTIILIVTLLLISALAFLAFQIIPGDPTTKILGTDYTPERAEALRHELEHLARDHFYAPDPVALQEAEAAGSISAPALRHIRAYRGTAGLERYLRSIDALEKTIEQLGKPW